LTTALSSAGAGDIVYLAPGSYRGTYTLGVSGTAGNTIQFIGDTLGTQNIGGIAAGIVRITNYLVDNVNPSIGTLLTATSRSYFSFANIYFESYNNSVGFLGILTTCTNWSFEKCTFITIRSSGLNVTTSASVALNASFTKCTFSSSGTNVALYCANHSSAYSLNLNFIECVCTGALSQQLTVMGSTSTLGSQTNAGGINYFNCLCYGFMIQNYSTNTTQPSYVYNCFILNTAGFALLTQTSGSLIENYNFVFGSTNAVTAGANSFYAGSIGLDYGHSAIVGLPAPSVNGPYLGSRLLGAGTATGAPATDADGVAWYQSLLGMGAYTYAARNNVIAFPLTPTQTTITISPASTSQSIELYLGATGLTFSTSGLAAYYVRNQSAPVAITLVTQTPTGAWASGGFAEIDSSAVPGVYRLDVPNAAFAAGASDVTIVVRGASGTNGAVLTVTLSSGGLTAAQTASAVLDAVASIHNNAGSIGASIQDKAGYSLSTPQSFSTTGSVGSVTGNVAGNVTGTVGGVVGNVVGNITGSVATVASPDNIIDGVWDEQRTGHTAAGSFGEKLQTNALADEMLARDLGSGLNAGTAEERTVRSALRALRNKINVGSSQMVVKKEDDTTDAWTATVTTTAVSSNVSGIDPN
jgi:hypothetical protein